MDNATLNETLRRFYSEVRQQNGKYYQKSSYTSLRSSISRHLKNPPYLRQLELKDDIAFSTSNHMFSSMLRTIKIEGFDNTKHNKHIKVNDLDILRKENPAFLQNTPDGLQRKVWYDIHFNFARRGNQNDRNLKKDAFRVCTDPDGCEFLEMTFNEATKNHSGDTSDLDYEKPRMYGNSTSMCPIRSYKRYIGYLNPANEWLWQSPKNLKDINSNVWYTKQTLGIHSLRNMMKKISDIAKLSTEYTNHGCRGAAITTLLDAGVSEGQVMHLSKHKNPKSLLSYCHDSSEQQKKTNSKILQGLDQNITLPVFKAALATTSNSKTANHVSTSSNPTSCSQKATTSHTPFSNIPTSTTSHHMHTSPTTAANHTPSSNIPKDTFNKPKDTDKQSHIFNITGGSFNNCFNFN